MGGSSSKQEPQQSDNTNVNDGTIINDVNINNSVPIHNDYFFTILLIICACHIIQVIYLIYKNHVRSLKKKYSRNTEMV